MLRGAFSMQVFLSFVRAQAEKGLRRPGGAKWYN
jgi:hypothetical protein